MTTALLKMIGVTAGVNFIQQLLMGDGVKKFFEKLWVADPFMITLESEDNRQMFDVVLTFLATLPYFRDNCLSVTLPRTYDVATDLKFVPAASFHDFEYEGVPVKFVREVREKKGVVDRETILLCVSKEHRSTLLKLMKDADAMHRAADKIKVWGNVDAEWYEMPPRERKFLRNYVFGPDIIEEAASITRFFEQGELYHRRGVPWRRGYLLHGEPGCGKSSFIQAVASENKCPIFYLTLGAFPDDSALLKLIGSIPPKKCLLVIEDIDEHEYLREGHAMSGLLNAIDGLPAGEGRVLIMTSNRPENIDYRLLRVGRIDVRLRFGHLTMEQGWELFLKFFGAQGATQPILMHAQFIAEWEGLTHVSSASVQQALMITYLLKLRQPLTPVYAQFFIELRRIRAEAVLFEAPTTNDHLHADSDNHNPANDQDMTS